MLAQRPDGSIAPYDETGEGKSLQHAELKEGRNGEVAMAA